MKKVILCLLLAVTAASFSSCATTHLWRWGMNKTSAVHTIENEPVEPYVKPASTLLGTPVALAWDAVTLPFQLIFWVFPYGDRYMVPAEKKR